MLLFRYITLKNIWKKSFESIADQTYDNLEIVFVDDGATDEVVSFVMN